jgi:hypothetical protein
MKTKQLHVLDKTIDYEQVCVCVINYNYER